MPRVVLCTEQKRDYMVTDLPYYFEKEARKKGLHAKDLAKAIGISSQSWSDRKSKKQNGKPRDTFSYGELLILFDFLDTPEYDRLKLLAL